jgi:hypothetical protein
MSRMEPEPYTYRVNVLRPVTTVTLGPDGVVVSAEDGVTRRVPYSQISQVRLSYEPTRVQSDLYFCRLWTQGESAPFALISSTRYRGFLNFETQLGPYRALVEALHARLAAHRHEIAYRAGVSTLAYWGNALFVTMAFGFAGAVFYAIGGDYVLQTRHWLRLGIAAALVPLALAWFWANRPRPYDPRAIPPELLPTG